MATKLLHSFANPSIFIQGASAGIGLQFVRECLGQSHVSRVFASCRDPWKARNGELVQLADADPRLTLVKMDITDEAQVSDAASTIMGSVKAVHLLVNCAGVLHQGGMRPERQLADVHPENLAHSFAVNAIGPLLVVKHLSPLFPRAERCVVVNISARVGSIGDNKLGGWYAYRAAKAAQNQLTRTMAIELARKHKQLSVIALHPGTVATALSEPFQQNVRPETLQSSAECVLRLIQVIDGLTVDDNGSFLAWDGRPIPW